MMATVKKIAHVAFAIGEKIGALAMGLTVTKLSHVALPPWKLPQCRGEGFIAVGGREWRE